tara:strand:+ start:487 stop:603 length:117 start_codon:yes stop_codon:yes gene_type:complete
MELIEVKWKRWVIYKDGKVVLQTTDKLVAIRVMENDRV